MEIKLFAKRISILFLLILAITTNMIYAQNTDIISGRVSSSIGEPMIGASVMVKGTTNGTITDLDGNFKVEASSTATLIISYVGYVTQEVQIAGRKAVNITLKEDTGLLEEIVVVGFGTQKKVNWTGAVGLADAESLKERPVLNATQALQGLVPGLQITQTNGTLGDTPTINIRGTGTIGEGSSGSPLILIDGMEGDLNMINPQDIASVSVLKDAASSSIYGSRAPFGVILITTKTGSKDKISINYNNSFRWASPIKMMKMMNSVNFASFLNDAMTNSGRSPQFVLDHVNRMEDYMNAVPCGPGQRRKVDGTIIYAIDPDVNGQWLDGYANGIDNVNIFDEIYKGTTFNQEHNFSASGGNDRINYYVSFNYMHQDGFMKIGNDDLKRYNTTTKLNITLTDWLKLNLSTRFTRQDYEHPFFMDNWEYYELVGRSSWPNIPLYDRNGYYFNAPSVPLKLAEQGSKMRQTDNLYQQVGFMIEPIKNWVTHINFNYRINNVFNRSQQFAIYNHDINGEPYSSDLTSGIGEDISKENYYNFEVYSEYTHSFKEKHNLHVLVGSQIEDFKRQTHNLYRDGIILNSKPEVDLTTGLGSNGSVVSPTVGGQRSEWGLVGFFGRLNYDFEGKYLFEGNLRYDGSSRFRKNNRWKLFPSFSLGWNIAREDFFRPLAGVIGTLKLRGSWGQLGNNNTDKANAWYPFYQNMITGSANSGWLIDSKKQNTAQLPGIVNSLMTWETIESWDIGLDFGLLDNRLTGSVGYYNRYTYDMIGPAPILPPVLGALPPQVNNCDMKSYGWELELSWRDRISEFDYSARFVLSDGKRKILRYPNPTNSLSSDVYYNGQILGDIWGYKTIGIAQTQEEMNAHLANGGTPNWGTNWGAGDVMYANLDGKEGVNNGSNTLEDHGDLTIIGNNTPRYNFGLTLTGAWKGFDFSVFLQGVMKRDYWLDGPYFWGANGGLWQSTAFKEHMDYWRPEGDPLGANTNAYYPKPYFNTDKNQKVQSGYLQNAAYCRLKNAQIGYTLPKTWTRKAAMESVRVYVSGDNLVTFSGISGVFDPELLGSDWGDGKLYPLQRTISIGLNVNF